MVEFGLIAAWKLTPQCHRKSGAQNGCWRELCLGTRALAHVCSEAKLSGKQNVETCMLTLWRTWFHSKHIKRVNRGRIHIYVHVYILVYTYTHTQRLHDV